MTRSSRGEGLSLAYHLGYRLRLAALSLLGPAESTSRAHLKKANKNLTVPATNGGGVGGWVS